MVLKRPRILIADDHALVAEAIRKLLEREFDVVGVVANGRLVLREAEKLRPDIILLDITMPEMNGIDAAKLLRETLPAVQLVFLTQQTDRQYVQAAFQAGAKAYVVKQSAAADLDRALKSVLDGRHYISPSLEAHLPSLAELLSSPADLPVAAITARQREVLQLVAEGKTLKDVADALNISVKAAEFHKRGIMEALKLRTTAELTRYALEHGLIAFKPSI
ncbi:MAG TPA: response regulator transcription factor [Terriglobales bacterium]|nr:response regulator transcription factor [Terriglobales bacterium]